MEVLDKGGFEIVQVPKGGSKVADEGSIPNIPLPESVGSIPNGSDLEINQVFETIKEL